jgi:hypothetical protein
MRISDLPKPDEWQVDDSSDEGPDDFQQDLDACERRYDPTLKSAEASTDSDTFTRGQLLMASSSGWVVRDQAKRDAFFDSIDEQLACAGRVLAKYLRGQSGLRIRVPAPYEVDAETTADRDAGWTLQIGISSGSGQADGGTLFIDLVAVEQGELLAAYLFFHAGELTLEDQTRAASRGIDRVAEVEDR